MSLAGLVLSAGLGTRIAPLTALVPKPLLPVGGSTPFARAVAALRAAGASPVVANASHLASQLVDAGRALSVDVFVEPDGPRGTAGGVATARSTLGAGPVLVWNGDVVADLDARGLIPHGAFAVLAVRALGPAGTGNVGLDDQGRIVRLRRQSFGAEVRGGFYAAVMGLSAPAVERCPTRGCLVGDLLIPALAEGASAFAVRYEGAWHDIGDLASYLAANLAEPFVDPAVEVPPDVQLGRVALARGVTLRGAGRLDEVVAWEGAVVTAPQSRAVVTREGLVRV